MKFRFDLLLFFKKIFLIFYDSVSIVLASSIALLLRYDFLYNSIDKIYIERAWEYLPINLLTTFLIFYLFKMYSSLWTYAGVTEMQSVVSAVIVASFVQMVGMIMLGYKMPRSYYFIYGLILLILVLFIRFAYRFLRILIYKLKKTEKRKNLMIIGAGSSSNILISEIMNSKYLDLEIKCIIDDNIDKIGKFIRGKKIVGNRYEIINSVSKYNIDQIIIAMPSVPKSVTKEIIEICRKTKCELKILPGVYQLVSGEIKVSNLRDIEIEDLLGREAVKIGLDTVMGYVQNKTVLVTGGGGSIGSELCRQIAFYNPEKLLIIDIYENNAYDIQNELLRKYPKLNLVVLVASVRNTLRIKEIFEEHKPNIVFHAAAHKHVPLMEQSPTEAIKNNVFGTLKTATMADKFGVEKFILISTDKAVNPTNIMGASKRLCEMIVQSFNEKSKTEFAAVRFGNVLGSNGSVIPLFKKQIASGGPVCVTHPDIVRYFMTIPEAVSLVLQAGAFAKGGEIFVLDMGEPVKILDLAKNLITLSGYTPNEDMQIKFTGLREGEKLYEELLMSEEGLEKTENELIFIGKPISFDMEKFWLQLDELKISAENESENIKELVKKIVTTYKNEEIYKLP